MNNIPNVEHGGGKIMIYYRGDRMTEPYKGKDVWGHVRFWAKSFISQSQHRR